jgi:predicted  nucleic acid-binding Zn ribbon protein
MLLVEINFGQAALPKPELEDVAESYISSLFHYGQLCGEYFITWIKHELICHALMAGAGADKTRFHSDWSKRDLKKVIQVFGRPPTWNIRDDEAPTRNISWRAPTLYLFTHAFDWDSPLCRGDNGKPVPTFCLPLTLEQKEDLYRWQQTYILHDQMWLDCGTLEIPAYKELAEADSSLSRDGRKICGEIEKAAGRPTYYFLMRHYAAAGGEDDRPCPSCGRAWRRPQAERAPLHYWRFRCEPCRLVSQIGVDINKRMAKVGTWRRSGG